MSSLPVFEAEKWLYVEDEVGHRQRDTTNGNNYWSLNVSFSFSFHLCKFITDDSCVPNFSFKGWILQHFPCISSWASLPDITEDMPCATAFIPPRENQTIEPYKFYLDHLVFEDMHFNNYVDHPETHPFDEIVIYFGWLACKLRLIAPHLPERIMLQFRYTQTIPKHPDVSAPPALTHIQVDDMFDDYESHLVSEEAWATIVERDWSYVKGYIRWLSRVSHPYMVQAAPRDPLRPFH